MIDVQVTMIFRVCLADEKSDLASRFDGELARKVVAEAARNAVEAAEQDGFTHQDELDLSLQFRDLTTKEPRNNKLPKFAAPRMNLIVPVPVEFISNDHAFTEFLIGDFAAFFVTRFV